jgi:hypothetical protein
MKGRPKTGERRLESGSAFALRGSRLHLLAAWRAGVTRRMKGEGDRKAESGNLKLE